MIRIIIAAPFLALMVLFALSNPQNVKLGLWPTDYTIEVPLSLAILGAMGVAFFLGALLLWFSVVAAKVRAGRAEREVRRLDAEVKQLKVQVIRPTHQIPAMHAASSSSRSLAPVP